MIGPRHLHELQDAALVEPLPTGASPTAFLKDDGAARVPSSKAPDASTAEGIAGLPVRLAGLQEE